MVGAVQGVAALGELLHAAASPSTSSARCRRYAASHGCVRVNHYDAEMLFGFAVTGTPVDVFDEASV